jgi:hypothetical protein
MQMALLSFFAEFERSERRYCKRKKRQAIICVKGAQLGENPLLQGTGEALQEDADPSIFDTT